MGTQTNLARRRTTTRAARWDAYAAGAWAVVFAAVSFYWAAGGTVGAHTVAAKPEELASARELWLIGAVKLLPGLLALALVGFWGGTRLHRPLRFAAWVLGALLILYGAAEWVDHALMATDVVHTPALLGRSAVRWHLALWDPWWVLGGVLFAAAARASRRT